MAHKNKLYSALGAMTIGSIASSTSILPTSLAHAEIGAETLEIGGDYLCGGEKQCGSDKKCSGSKDDNSSEESEQDSE